MEIDLPVATRDEPRERSAFCGTSWISPDVRLNSEKWAKQTVRAETARSDGIAKVATGASRILVDHICDAAIGGANENDGVIALLDEK